MKSPLARFLRPNPKEPGFCQSPQPGIYIDAQISENRVLSIYGFGSTPNHHGNAKAFLHNLRPHFKHIVVHDAGNPAQPSGSWGFWAHMQTLGLVDEINPDQN